MITGQLDNDNLDSITDLMNSHNDWASGGQEYAAGNYSADVENGVTWTKFGSPPTRKPIGWVSAGPSSSLKMSIVFRT